MLELKNVSKKYKIGDIETVALRDISVAFREKEFVAILGPSGSGKTTCLNIIGGLDRYDNGEMTIKGKKTKDFKDRDWDAYRNNSIGFVFQSYNLITHISIVANVEMSLTLSGVSASEKRRRSIEVLKQVGLEDHLHKKPNQLSGGQMQRVAIARALVNNPEILLCDEPTGALDTTTSEQIMDLITSISKDRLVIMVTHNKEIAEQYADRIIQFQDGLIISDTHPHEERPKSGDFKIQKTSMSFFTALRLSANNLKTKKGRTFLTAFASSIGIIGIAVILSLSNGFNIQITDFQSNAMAEFPIIITQNSMNIDEDTLMEAHTRAQTSVERYPETDEVTPYDPSARTVIHKNILEGAFMEHLDAIDPAICNEIGYTRLVQLNVFRKVDGTVKPVKMGIDMSNMSTSMSSMSNAGLSSYPIKLDNDAETFLEKNYDVLAGQYPTSPTELVLIIDSRNRLDYNILKNLGFNTDDMKPIKFNDILGVEFKLAMNNDYYSLTEFGTYLPNSDYDAIYDSAESLTLKIVGILRSKESSNLALLSSGIAYSDELSTLVIKNAENSDIVKAQKEADYNIMSRLDITEEEKKMFLSVLGGDAAPFMVMIYPYTFETKDQITDYLDSYNEGKDKKDIVIYTDLAETISSMTSGIMNGITLVLIAFAAISLFVSLIMIVIITYTSVLERTKEIGILRALGARKKDITRVFDAETCILGIFSGVLGIAIAYISTIPINIIIYNVSELENVARLPILYAALLILISTVLTMLGGHIPARMASRKDAVEALRSE